MFYSEFVPILTYNNVYNITREDYINCEPGEGSISANPRFVDPENGDYHLQANSPCIDAGDPNSPLDPDGTRADIGAYYYHQELSAAPSREATLPQSFAAFAAPNPFNHETKLYFKLPQPGEVTIGIYDLQGREALYAELTARSPYGIYLLEGDLLGSAGVYFVKVKSGDRQEAFKVTYLP